MATLTIEGRKITVDDSFLQLTPEQQNSTVDEIAASLKKPAAPVSGIPDSIGNLVPAAIRDIPKEIGAAFTENLDAAKRGLLPSGQGERGVLENLTNTGAGALGLVGAAFSPITGAARSLIGHPLAAVEEYGRQFSGMPADPEGAYARGKSDADIAMMAAATGRPGAAARVPPALPSEGQSVVSAANRLSDAFDKVNVPRAIASDSMAAQRLGQAVRNLPIVGDAIPKATAGLVDDLGRTVVDVASQYGSGSGPNVASRIGRKLTDDAVAETQAATNAVRASDDAVISAWQRSQDDALRAIGEREAQTLDRTRAAVGDMSPQDMGRALIDRLRTSERQARAEKERLYGVAGQGDGAIQAGAVRGLRADIEGALHGDGRVIDPVLTPAASRMMAELDNAPLELSANMSRRGTAAPASPAVSMQALEQTRKRLNAMSRAATNDADRAASRQIIRRFDERLAELFDSSLFSGSDQALNAYRQARAANTEWRQRFGYNAQSDADRIINRIVTGEVTPQEVSNWLIGAAQVGGKGSSSRLLGRIVEATGGDAEALAAIRGGVWNRLSQATEGTTAKPPEKVASGINEFLNGSGRDLAGRLFTPEQQNIMRAYADTIRQGQAARETVTEIARNTKPAETSVGIGPMRDLAETVLGKSGKSDEAIFSAIDSYAKSGSRGDIATLARIVRAVSEGDRGDLAGAIIRKLGVSPRTGQFSPDVFASQWASYTPQAKTILFGNAGPHRQALDDIMTISNRLKAVGNRFGNPSGTAQNINLAGMVAWAFSEPLSALSAAIGGAATAKILAAPAGASSAAKLAKAQARLAMSNGAPAAIAGYRMAAVNLANTAQSLGVRASATDLIRFLQAPAQVRAEDQQNRVPRPPGQ